MATTNKGSIASIKYAKTHKRRIPLDVQNDYYDNTLKPICDQLGIPVNTFIKQAITHEIERVTQSGPVRDTNTESDKS